MNNMYFPTGPTTNGHTVVCLCCCDDIPVIESSCTPIDIIEKMSKWMNENKYCTEAWQMEKMMWESGYPDFELDENDMGGGGAMATLNTTPGMGPVTPPQGPGTNANFYDVAKQGSGDKFDSLTVGTPAAQNDDKKKKKKRTIQTFMDFSKAMKMLQEK